ncbi:uncharacterized protein LOC142356439 isoform X2 [Convolutriloba macropyga]|uniref:uncharacterized protein LOC142356439 isoform X2 n=1 Tax=Convolutriloba macropyga TaxID=536237 RepID=UPI003F5219E8
MTPVSSAGGHTVTPRFIHSARGMCNPLRNGIRICSSGHDRGQLQPRRPWTVARPSDSAFASLEGPATDKSGAGHRSSPRVAYLDTFPVKGLPNKRLPRANLEAGGCLPADREWAIIMGRHSHLWDPDNPAKLFIEKGLQGLHHSSKVKFHQLITDEVLAALKMEYDIENKALFLQHEDMEVGANLRTLGGIAVVEDFFTRLLAAGSSHLNAPDDSGPPLKLVHGAQGTTHQFGNVGGTQDKLLLHLVNLESVKDFEGEPSISTAGHGGNSHEAAGAISRCHSNDCYWGDDTLGGAECARWIHGCLRPGCARRPCRARQHSQCAAMKSCATEHPGIPLSCEGPLSF